ncbi:MAG TPA: tetratricopeptide repeat protein, partial [Bacteroidia bacterium]|nr:tetratricopeptide repeat protein [Bacteroidia bacterium]
GLKGIPDLMTKDFFSGIYGKALDLGGGRYRPLSLVMFAVEHQFFGNNPHPSHLINIILYGFCSIVLFLLLLDFFPEQPLISIAASLLFIAHPLHTEVVANIKSRDEILSFLFLCLTLCYTLKYAKSDLKKYFFYGCIFYFLALFSKENGITFLAIIPLTIYFFTDKTNIKTCLKKSVPFFVTAFIYLALRTYMVGLGAKSSSDIMENPFVNATFFERMATISCISGKYLWMLIFPFPLSSDYSFNQIPIINWTSLKALIPFLIFLFLLIWAIKNAKQKHPVSYGILFFFITYSIVSNVFFNIGAPMGERFLFLPSLGFCIAIAWLLNYFSMKKNPLKNKFSVPITLFISAVLLIFSVETIARNKDWKNNITLFSTDVNTVPNSAKVHYYYGNSILIKALKLPDGEVKTNMLEKSKSEFLKSVEINPKFYTSFYNLGLIFKTENNPDSAIYYLQKVLALSPQHILTQGLLGSIYGKEKGDFDKAILYLKKAVLFNPQDLGSWENLGIAYAMKKNFPDALNAFQHAQQLNPTDAQAYLNIAITYQNMGEKEKASPYFAKAFELNPALKK